MKSALVLLALLTVTLVLHYQEARAIGTVPAQTDDGLDPVNLVFTGYAPAWWVVQKLNGWNPTSCSEPKTLDRKSYDFTLETPDTRGQSLPCWGPKYHIRIWNMGTDPVLGEWSTGAVHHEHTACSYVLFCHHVIDSWEDAESLVRSTFLNGAATLSISNYTMGNSGFFQGFYNDGNATVIMLSHPNIYPVTFVESGLRPETTWTVTLNGETSSSSSTKISFYLPNGTYQYSINSPPGYDVSRSAASLTVQGNAVEQSVIFTETRYIVSFTQTGLPKGTNWSVTFDGATSSSTTSSIMFSESGGTHSYSIGSVPGYRADSSSGRVDVSSDQSITVRFTSTQTLASVAGQPMVLLFLSVALTAWAVVFGAAVLVTRRKRR